MKVDTAKGIETPFHRIVIYSGMPRCLQYSHTCWKSSINKFEKEILFSANIALPQGN